MTRRTVIAGRSDRAKDVRAAADSRYGTVVAAEGHLPELCTHAPRPLRFLGVASGASAAEADRARYSRK